MNPRPGRKLFGILVTFRRREELSTVLESLAVQDMALDRLVVVDNDSSAAVKELVLSSSLGTESIEYLGTPENLGPAGAIALGMDRILEFANDSDWIVLVDDDDPPFSTTLLRDLKEFGESMVVRDPTTAAVGLVGARFDLARGRLVGMSRIASNNQAEVVPVDYIGGGRFPLYLAGAVRAVGPFSSKLFFAFDDLEYGLRLRSAGFSLYAHRSLWLQAMRTDRHIGLDVRPSYSLAELSWRRYYELRNVIHILNTFGWTGTALRISLTRGVGKPLANLIINPREAVRHLSMNVRACLHAWTGKMGRTVEPDTNAHFVSH